MKSNRIYAVIFFSIYLIIGIFIYKDYGVPWDEGSGIRNAIINCVEVNKKFNYLLLPKSSIDRIAQLTGKPDSVVALNSYIDKDYGCINEIIVTFPTLLFTNLN